MPENRLSIAFLLKHDIAFRGDMDNGCDFRFFMLKISKTVLCFLIEIKFLVSVTVFRFSEPRFNFFFKKKNSFYINRSSAFFAGFCNFLVVLQHSYTSQFSVVYEYVLTTDLKKKIRNESIQSSCENES